MNANEDPYDILGVDQTATEAEIKKAYRKLALKNHPDRQTIEDDKERAQSVFAKIANAYEILSNPEEREQYDLRKKYGGSPGTRYTKTADNHRTSPDVTRGSSSSGGPTQRTKTETTPSSQPASNSRNSGPSSTKFSTTKDGKFTATVTNADGTTFTFMGTANSFHDPMEVFRKAFQEKTGEDLPEELRMKQKTTATRKNTQTHKRTGSTKQAPTASKSSSSATGGKPRVTSEPGVQTKTEVKGNKRIITKTETFADGRSRTWVEEVPINNLHTPATATKHQTPAAATKHQTKNASLRRNIVPGPTVTRPTQQSNFTNMCSTSATPLVQKGASSKSSKTYVVHHDNGQIETITEITETMPDGSMRSSSSSTFSTPRQFQSKVKQFPPGQRQPVSVQGQYY